MYFDLQEIQERLNSDDPLLRQEACYFLIKLEDAEVLPLLQKALTDKDKTVRKIARQGLKRLVMIGVIKEEDLIISDDEKEKKETVKKNDENVESQINKNFDGQVKQSPTQKLVNLINQYPEKFKEWFKTLSQVNKIKILSLLEKTDKIPKFANLLQEIMVTEKDAFVLSKMVKVFGYHHGSGAYEFLNVYLRHKDARVVANCLEGLAMAGGEEDILQVVTFLNSSDPRIKTTAANCLWERKPKIAFEIIKKMASSTKIWEKESALFALKNCPLPQAASLKNRLEKELKSLKDELDKKKQEIQKKKRQKHNRVIELKPDNTPLWKKIAYLPVHIGLEEPVALWEFLTVVIFFILFSFFVVNPIMDYIFPV